MVQLKTATLWPKTRTTCADSFLSAKTFNFHMSRTDNEHGDYSKSNLVRRQLHREILGHIWILGFVEFFCLIEGNNPFYVSKNSVVTTAKVLMRSPLSICLSVSRITQKNTEMKQTKTYKSRCWASILRTSLHLLCTVRGFKGSRSVRRHISTQFVTSSPQTMLTSKAQFVLSRLISYCQQLLRQEMTIYKNHTPNGRREVKKNPNNGPLKS